MTIALPTAKTAPSLTSDSAKVLLFGPPKIGKSTFCAGLDPDHVLFLACEPGLGALETFAVPVTSWEEFREVGVELKKGKHDFRIVVVDTVDELVRMCQDSVVKRLGIAHPSDLDYGKGWSQVGEEFRLRIANLANLGLGVWFVSHSKDVAIKTKVGEVTKSVPDIGGQARSFLVGFCDLILFATSTLGEHGEERLLRTAASENYEAGGRYQLADPLPLDPEAFKAAFEAAVSGDKVSVAA
jgi:hypothetical protein